MQKRAHLRKKGFDMKFKDALQVQLSFDVVLWLDIEFNKKKVQQKSINAIFHRFEFQ